MSNYINFSELGFAKCNEFEMPTKNFFEKMMTLILKENDGYGVYYSEEDNNYRIIYNHNEYLVKTNGYLDKEYDNKTIQYYLKQLSIMTDVKKKIEEEEETKEENTKKEYIRDKADDVVKKKVESLNKKLEKLETNYKANVFDIKKELSDMSKDLIYGEISDESAFLRSMFGGAGMIGLLVSLIMIFVIGSAPLLLLIPSIVTTIDGLVMVFATEGNYGFQGVYRFIMSILGTIILTMIYLLSSIPERIKLFINSISIKREIKKIMNKKNMIKNLKNQMLKN